MATKVLQAMATNAAVDRPVVLSSDSIRKTALLFPESMDLDIKIGSVMSLVHNKGTSEAERHLRLEIRGDARIHSIWTTHVP